MNAGAAGFRLDVADELPDIILDEINKAIKSHGENSLVIGEVWEDASNKIAYSRRRRYLLGGQLDSVMNYPFRDSVLNYVRHGHDREFLTTVNSIVENYPLPALNCAMNPLSTHDTERALTVLAAEPSNGRDRLWQADHHYLDDEAYWQGVSNLKLAAALQYFLPGIPSLYYGDETGLSGYRDPFNRCCYPWGNENADLVDWFKRLGQIRLQADFLRDCKFTPLCVNKNICSYIRHKDEEHQLLVAVNRGDKELFLPLPKAFRHVKPLELCGSYKDGKLDHHSAVVFIIKK
jgi:glycosidase